MNKEVQDIVKTEAEAEEIKEFIRRIGDDEKGIDSFFLEIIRDDESLKIGNLSEDELGLPDIPLRTILELKRDANSVPSLSSFVDDFTKQSQELIATSLSKDGFLINARITQKKSLTDSNKRKKKRKGFFGGIKEVEEE